MRSASPACHHREATLPGIASQALECPRFAFVPGGRDVEEDVEQRRFARLEAPERMEDPIEKLPRHLGLEVLIPRLNVWPSHWRIGGKPGASSGTSCYRTSWCTHFCARS